MDELGVDLGAPAIAHAIWNLGVAAEVGNGATALDVTRLCSPDHLSDVLLCFAAASTAAASRV